MQYMHILAYFHGDGLNVSIWMYVPAYEQYMTLYVSMLRNVSIHLPGIVRNQVNRLGEYMRAIMEHKMHTPIVFCSFFSGPPPDNRQAKSWPTSCCTGGCPNPARPDGRTRPADSTRPCGRACSSSGNGAVISSWNQGRFTQDVR